MDLFWILVHNMIVRYTPRCWIVFEGLLNIRLIRYQYGSSHTVFNCEQSSERTTCLSGQVARYVMALTPFTGMISAML